MSFLKNIIATLLLLMISQIAKAQYESVYPAAICSNGILLGKYKKANDAENPLPDTITIEDAKSIIALNVISIDKNRMISRMKVISYQMTIHDPGDTTTIKNSSELLTREMKTRLNKIKSGSKLIFEGILTEFSDSPDVSRRGVIVLVFTVK